MIKEKTPLVFRHEEKHLISRQEDFLAAGRLRKLFRRDAHAGPEGIYQVNSLYFDTPSDSALRQKLGTAAQHIRAVYGAGYRLGGKEDLK